MDDAEWLLFWPDDLAADLHNPTVRGFRLTALIPPNRAVILKVSMDSTIHRTPAGMTAGPGASSSS